MSFGQIVLLVYALLMIGGGFMGSRKGSAASLYAGGGSGLLLLVAFAVTFFNPTSGLWFGALVAGLLCLIFLIRLSKTGKVMPSGMLLGLSIAATVLLVLAVG